MSDDVFDDLSIDEDNPENEAGELSDDDSIPDGGVSDEETL